MPEKQSFIFEGGPERLDRYLAERLSGLSRTYLQRLIKEGRVTVDGRATQARHRLSPGQRVEVTLPDFSSLPGSAVQDVPVLFEDSHLIVVNKPPDVVVHPAGPHQEGTLIQRLWPKLAANWSAVLGRTSPHTARPGVVHRLDKGTSGVLVIAKTPQAAEHLSAQFAARTVKKVYLALVCGIPKTEKGRIRSTVGRSRRAPHRMSVEDPGRWSETEFKVLERFEKTGAALLEVQPLTGRTHQIRVQLAHLGHPLAGDMIYGAPKDLQAERPLLHALSLELTHPANEKRMKWTAGLPEDFEEVLRDLRGKT